jgi:hypothetical protein
MGSGALPTDLLDHPTNAQVLKYLKTVQSYQDGGWTWREAVDTAHRMVTSPPWSVLLAPPWEPAEPVPVDA